MLKVRSLRSGYPGVPVLEDVSCDIDQGQIVAFFGHNGAGKTTLLKSIFGLIAGVRGSVSFCGREVLGFSAKQLTQLGIAYVPQEQGVFSNLTVQEHLRIGLWARPEKTREDKNRTLEQVFEYLPMLKERGSEPAGNLSGGQQQMLSIGRALLTQPNLLMLDEPSTGLAPNLVKEVMQLVWRLREENGLSVLLVEQNVGAALEIAGSAYLMKSGRIIRSASPQELSDSQTLWSLF